MTPLSFVLVWYNVSFLTLSTPTPPLPCVDGPCRCDETVDQMLVIDEADEMLNKGFKEQIYDIYRYLPPSTQVVLISATMPQEVLDMTKKFMNMPVKILVKRDELTLEGIKQVQCSETRGINVP